MINDRETIKNLHKLLPMLDVEQILKVLECIVETERPHSVSEDIFRNPIWTGGYGNTITMASTEPPPYETICNKAE